MQLKVLCNTNLSPSIVTEMNTWQNISLHICILNTGQGLYSIIHFNIYMVISLLHSIEIQSKKPRYPTPIPFCIMMNRETTWDGGLIYQVFPREKKRINFALEAEILIIGISNS